MALWFITSLTVYLCWILAICTCSSEDSPKSDLADTKINNTDTGINYLVRFGYLSAKWVNRARNNRQVAFARSAGIQRIRYDPVRAAVLSFQRMANINQSGLIDNKTIEAMNWPRCGVTDEKLRNATEMAESRRRSVNARYPSANYVLFGTKWATTNLTYTITEYTRDIDHDLIDAAINDTLSKWASVARLKFIKVTKQPLMEIKWATTDHSDGESFDGTGGILAHSFFPPRRLTLGFGLPGDVHFDDDDYWALQPDHGKISLAHVSLHETGHAIGLDHTTDRTAVMYPFFTQSAMTRLPELTKDDIDGIQALYGTPYKANSPIDHFRPYEENADTSTTSPTSSTTSTTTTTAAATTTTTPTGPCPFIPGVGISAITQAADQSDSTFAVIKSKVYKIGDDGQVNPKYPKHISEVFPGAPPNITGLVTYVHTGTTFDRRYLYMFQGPRYWRYEIRKSAATLDEGDLDLLRGPTVLQMLVQQFLLGQKALTTKSTSPPSRNLLNERVFKLTFVQSPGYPKPIIVGFKGVDAPDAVIFQLVTDELIYFVTATQYWTFSPLQAGNSTRAPLSEHAVLRALPVRPPLLQSAMLYNGRNYFFASNGSYWVWSPSRKNTARDNDVNSMDVDPGYESLSYNHFISVDAGRWSMALSIKEWWFSCISE